MYKCRQKGVPQICHIFPTGDNGNWMGSWSLILYLPFCMIPFLFLANQSNGQKGRGEDEDGLMKEERWEHHGTKANRQERWHHSPRGHFLTLFPGTSRGVALVGNSQGSC